MGANESINQLLIPVLRPVQILNVKSHFENEGYLDKSQISCDARIVYFRKVHCFPNIWSNLQTNIWVIYQDADTI